MTHGDDSPTAMPRPAPNPLLGATQLLLIRHGTSQPPRADRPFPLLDGHGDPELTDEGRRQAELIAERLCGESIDALYVSNLRRTAQTAAPLAAKLGLTPHVEPDLREAHLGEWEGGVSAEKIAANGPIGERVLREERWDVIPGAEPAAEFTVRVRTAVERLVDDHTGHQVAVFTHGGVIAEILAYAARSRPFAFVGADYGSISCVFAASPHWILRRFNDTAHLNPGAPTPL
jgi:2,3-bisphosphoglycerate-dependent phosphoglycerate mutase